MRSFFVPLRLILLFICLLGLPVALYAGGPLYVGSPTFGVDAQIITWDPAAMPIQYRVDGGPMASTAAGATVISNATGISRVQSMFQTWQSVSTAAVSFHNAGPILATTGFSGGDVDTAQDSMRSSDLAGLARKAPSFSTPMAAFWRSWELIR